MRPKGSTNRSLPPRMLKRERKLKSGKVWVGYYYNGRDEGGRRIEIPLGSDLDEARVKWAQLERTKVPAVTRTVGDLLRRYTRDILPGKAPKTQSENVKQIRQLLNAFEDAPLQAITPHVIAQYRDARSAKVRANREISLLSHAFNLAREWGLTDQENPCRGVRRNKETPRDNYVTDEVWQSVYEQAPADLQRIMLLAYLTGQRQADVRGMRWSDVRDGFLHVDQDKTKHKLRIRLATLDGQPTQLGDLLDSLPRDTPYLVPTEQGRPITVAALRWRFEPARERAAQGAEGRHDLDLAAAIRRFQFRDIRPKAASEIADLSQASNLLGHTSEGITRRVYVRVGKVVDPVK